VPNNPQFKTTLNAQGGIVSPPGTPPLRISPWLIDPKLKTQYSESWFLNLQHEFVKGWIAEVGYIGTTGVNLERRDDINRFNGDLLINNGVQKRINPMGRHHLCNERSLLQLQCHDSRSSPSGWPELMVQANYRWSKWLDDESDTASSFWADNSQGSRGAQDASCLKCERGRSEFDIPKRFTASAAWTPEYFKGHSLLDKAASNWQLSTIVAVQSGRPFSVYCSASFQAGCDWKADGGGNIGNGYYDRPMAPAKGTIKSKFSQKEYVNGLFDPNVFPIPCSGDKRNIETRRIPRLAPDQHQSLPRSQLQDCGIQRVPRAMAGIQCSQHNQSLYAQRRHGAGIEAEQDVLYNLDLREIHASI
jgi:hypothetical protein